MPLLLFIYGTLHPRRAPREIAPIARRLKSLGPATIRGRLLDLGEYPGLLLGDAADESTPLTGQAAPEEARIVSGEVFEVPDQATLAALDRYEDFRSDAPEASLFLRVEAQVTLHDGRREMCWVYIYNDRVYNVGYGV